MKVLIDFSRCEKAGECYYNHPRVFDRHDNGFPAIRQRDITQEDLLHEAREAAQVCPTGAITLED